MRRVRDASLLVLALLVALPVPGAAQGPIAVFVEGPDAIAPGTFNEYTVTVTGGPAEEGGEFGIMYSLEGPDLSGAVPQTPRLFAQDHGVFEINITSPVAEGQIQLVVSAWSTREGVNETTETRFAINVFRSVDLRVTLRNLGAAAVVNVTVVFYVDDVRVGETVVPRIDAGSSVEVNLSWVPVGLRPGQHTIRVEADLDGDGQISPDRGELIAQDFFYKTEPTSLPAILATVTIVLIALLVVILLAIRRQRRLR